MLDYISELKFHVISSISTLLIGQPNIFFTSRRINHQHQEDATGLALSFKILNLGVTSTKATREARNNRSKASDHGQRVRLGLVVRQENEPVDISKVHFHFHVSDNHPSAKRRNVYPR